LKIQEPYSELYIKFPSCLSFDPMDAAVPCPQIFVIGPDRFKVKVSSAECLMPIFAIFRTSSYLSSQDAINVIPNIFFIRSRYDIHISFCRLCYPHYEFTQYF